MGHLKLVVMRKRSMRRCGSVFRDEGVCDAGGGMIGCVAHVRRRCVMLLACGAVLAALPQHVLAQQPAIPVVGFLTGLSAGERPQLVEAFRRGLSEVGYVAGQNVTVEYRYAENQPDRLRALISDLIARGAAV